MKENQYVAVRRDTGEKIVMRKCGMEDDLPALLNTIQSALFARARTEMADHLKVATSFQEFLQHLDNNCLIQVGRVGFFFRRGLLMRSNFCTKSSNLLKGSVQ